jgi:hypothetical protein
LLFPNSPVWWSLNHVLTCDRPWKYLLFNEYFFLTTAEYLLYNALGFEQRIGVIGYTSLLAESGILLTRVGRGRQRVWACSHAERRLKCYGCVCDSSLRLSHRRPAAVAAGPGGNHQTYTRRGRQRVGKVCSFAGSATTRLAGVVPPARICWLLPGGYSVPDHRVRDLPARICSVATRQAQCARSLGARLFAGWW